MTKDYWWTINHSCKEKTVRDILEICVLINLHMNPFSWNKDETVQKQIKLVGADLVSKLQLLHKANEVTVLDKHRT